jgi:hypothetical protein
MRKLLSHFRKCKHDNISWVFTLRTHDDKRRTRTYVVCFDCYQRIEYDWDTMTIGKPIRQRVA